MTPEQQQEMWDWYQERKVQQLSYPVDDASKNSLGAATYNGTSSRSTTTTVNTPAGGGNITVAARPAGFIVVNIQGADYIIAYYT